MRWNALQASQRCEVPRVPFDVRHEARTLRTGSVARAHLSALSRWPEALQVDERGVTLTLPAAERVPFFAEANVALRDAGLIVAWRDETYPVLAQDTRELLATFERAASRFWGTITFGAHCNGYVAGPGGRPERVWIARRSARKATDPGLLDNLVGGGVPHGQTPRETVLREGWEEAGLKPAQMQALRPGRLMRLARDIPEGFMLEWLSVYDLALPREVQPANQDGEVQSLQCLPVDEALALAAGDEMTVDAAMVMLDFALRHRLLDDAAHRALEQACTGLWIGHAE